MSDTPTLTHAEIIPDPRNVRDNAAHDVMDMADSIRVNGVLQPLSINIETKQIIGGHRRHAAIGLLIDSGDWVRNSAIPVHYVSVTDDAERSTLQLMLVENLQRVDLNPVEEAHAFDKLKDEFELNQKQIAERIGKSASLVSHRLRLLKLPDSVLSALTNGTISLDQAEAMVPLADNWEYVEAILSNPERYSPEKITEMVARHKLNQKIEVIKEAIVSLGGIAVSNYKELQELQRIREGENWVDLTKTELKKRVVEGEIYWVANNYQQQVLVCPTVSTDSTTPDKKDSTISEEEKAIKAARKERNAAIAELVTTTSFTGPQLAQLSLQYVIARASAAAHKLACTYLGVSKEDVNEVQGFYQWEEAVSNLITDGGAGGKRALAALMLAEFELRNGATIPPKETSEISKALFRYDIMLDNHGAPKVEEKGEETNEGDNDD